MKMQEFRIHFNSIKKKRSFRIGALLFGLWYLMELFGLGIFSLFYDSKNFQQALLVILILGLAMYGGKFSHSYQAMPRATRLTLLGMILFSLVAQLGSFRQKMFPFVPWTMYGHSDIKIASVYRYLVKSEGLETITEWVPAREALTFSEHRINDALVRFADQDEELYEQTIASLVKLANKRRSYPIDRVYVEQAKIPTWPYKGKESVMWKPVAEFDF